MAYSAEAAVVAALAGLGVRVYPDVGPSGVARPYVTYQAVGGQDITALDGPADLENARMQVNVWANDRLTAVATMRSVMTRMVAAGHFPIGAPVSDHEGDTNLYGSRLDFSVWYRP